MKTILTPIDFSEVSDAVIEHAVSLARAHNGRLVLLNIVQPPVITADYGAGYDNLQELIAVTEKAAHQRLQRFRTLAETTGLDVEIIQETGAAVPAILEVAKAFQADFIVMGSHGHTAFYDLIVGSTTHGVLKGAACPVVILPAPKKPEKASVAAA